MKFLVSLGVALVSCGLACLTYLSTSAPATLEAKSPEVMIAQLQDQDQEKPQPGLTSNQALMRDKLKHMSQILSGLTMDNFDQVAENAVTLAMISRATSWHIPEPTAKYQRLSKNFQEQARDLERHALEKNIEAATLDLVRMNISCTECHQHMRDHLGIGK